MTESRIPGTGPILLLAVGVIASTIVAWLLSHSSWLALLGPAIMALALIGTSAMIPQPHVVRRKAIRRAIILGASLLLASAIVVTKDPALLALIMPILGGGAGAAVATIPKRGASSLRAKENWRPTN